MLEMNEIKSFFPEQVHQYQKNMLREYVQHLALKFIFSSHLANKLIFIGGTALRVGYNTQRFSEDLDFDNKKLSLQDWHDLADIIDKNFKKFGFEIEPIEVKQQGKVFHFDLRFPGIYNLYNLSPHKNHKLKIKLDTEDQGVNYKSNLFTLNKFNIISKIKIVPLDVALSQKLRAFMHRQMGRDLFDISVIAPRTKANYDYLHQTLGISDSTQLKKLLLQRIKEFDLKALVERAKPFLFNPDDSDRILYFQDLIKQHDFFA